MPFQHSVPFHSLEFNEPFALEFGGELPELVIRYETWGTPAPSYDNAVLVCPAFSADAHARSHPGNPKRGWWEDLIGPGLAFDTRELFVICPALLGGSRGTTGPTSIDPATGKAYGPDFPEIGVRDIVNAHVRLLDHLGIERLQAAVGGSLGGMEAIELAVSHPGRVERVLMVAATDRTLPYTSAVRHLGRQAIQMARRLGDADDGLRLAREIATIFYRSRREFNQRFDIATPPADPDAPPFGEMQAYLAHQGDKALRIFDIDAYLTLSLAMDLHDVWRGFPSREAALGAVDARFLIAGIEEDGLISIREQQALHRTLVAAGQISHWRQLSSPVGHDAFLVETGMMTKLVRELFLL